MTRSTPRSHATAIASLGLGLLLLLASPLLAHNSRYHGPAGQVPPTGRQPTDPPPPRPDPPVGPPRPDPVAAGRGPSSGPAAPSTATPGVGGAKGTTGSGRPGIGLPAAPRGASRRKKSPDEISFESWEYWWDFNRCTFLTGIVRRGESATNALEYSLGRLDPGSVKEVTAPSRSQVDLRVIPALIAGTGDPHFDVRASSVIALGKMMGEELRPLAPALLRDEDQEVRTSTCLALGLSGDAIWIPLLEKLVKGQEDPLVGGVPDEIMRVYAAAALSFLGRCRPDAVDRVASILRGVLDERCPLPVRLCATVGLGMIPSTASVPHLLTLGQRSENDPLIRAHAIGALARLGDPAALPLFLSALRDPSVHVARSAVTAVGLLGRTDADRCRKQLLAVAERGRDRQSSHWAWISIGRLGGGQGRRHLLEVVAGEGGSTQVFAALGLALAARSEESLSESELTVMMRSFHDAGDPRIRGGLAIALGLAGAARATPLLEEELRTSRDPVAQGYCAEALGMLGATEVLPVLEAAILERRDPSFRRPAARALGILGGRQTVPVLIGELAHGATLLDSLGAAEALGFLGDASAIPSLSASLRDRVGVSSGVRAAAAVALGLLGSPPSSEGIEILARDINYRAFVPTLHEILSIL